MKRFTIIFFITFIINGCATGQDGTHSPTKAQIMEACMKVEVPLAVAGDGDKKPMNVEDAKIYSSLICKVMSGICGEDPNAQGCEANLKRYGFGPK